MEFVRSKTRDPGVRARLRRSLRSGDTLTADILWILGGWLPDNHEEALILARVAGWISAHPSTDAAERWRTLAGEISRPDYSGSDDSKQRLLEAVTREGIPASTRCEHITRGLQASPDPKRIDWAQMISDLIGLTRGGEWAHAVRVRWYREYHRLRADTEPAQQTPTTQGEQTP